MKFIKKESLIESQSNPLDVINTDLKAYKKNYEQAILNAVASESEAIVEYDQILELESKIDDKKLVDHFHDTILDLKNEEVKHLAQLTQKVSEIPSLQAAFEAGNKEAKSNKETSYKENSNKNQQLITEAVEKNRVYDTYTIEQIIANELNLNDMQYDIIENIFKSADDELNPEEVDRYIDSVSEYFSISETKRDNIENAIIASVDPKKERIDEFDSDISFDISVIEDSIEKVYSIAAKEQLYKVIQYLKNLKYDGDKEIGWTYSHSMFNNNSNNKRKIIA